MAKTQHDCTPAVLEHTWKVWRKHGENYTHAAGALGISRSAVQGRVVKYRRQNPALVKKSAKDDAGLEAAKAKELENQLSAVQAQLDQALEQLDRARQASKRNGIPRVKTRKGKCRIRAILPDVHGNHMDRDAVAACFADLEVIKPNTILQLGDLLECGGWLAQHHTLGYVAEVGQMSFAEDVDAANDFLDRCQSLAPHVELLEGNHEARCEKWCVTQTLKNSNGRDAEYLRRMVAPEYVLGLERRGIPYFNYHKKHDGLEVPGVIKRDQCYFTHGWSTNKHAASSHLARVLGNVVYGHTHRADYAVDRTVDGGIHAAWCPGTLSQMQPMWKHNSPTSWTHGYMLQFIAKDGSFQMLQVPIFQGKSFFSRVIESLRV